MDRRLVVGLFLLGLLVAGLSAGFQHSPGYMDAEYYYAGGLRLASGQGASEPYLWNYLGDPPGLPVPSFAYWMPLVSLLAAAGLKLASLWPIGTGLEFAGARMPFILLAACVPPLTAYLARRLSGQDRAAWLAGLLALFPGYYLAYMGTTEVFPVYMVMGNLFLLLAFGNMRGKKVVHPLLLGFLAGLMHLARADGLLWLAAALGVAVWLAWRGQVEKRFPLRLAAVRAALTLAGYAAVMSPWYARNLVTWGSLFPPGGSRALWIVEYGQTMIYPASLLTLQSWLAAGWDVHLSAWIEALGAHLQTTLAVQGGLVLLPFMLVGAWKLRRSEPVVLALMLWLATLSVMTVVFPYAGMNGGFFHSGAAFQPLLWALVPPGLEASVQWAARLRRWQRGEQVLRFLSVLLVVTAALLSGGLYAARVLGAKADLSQPDTWLWHQSQVHYQAVEQELVRWGAQPGQAVLVNNPPGYYLVSGRPGAVIPFGDVDMLLAVARRYQIDYLVLEENNPYMLADLYLLRDVPPGLEYLGGVGTTQLFEIRLQGEGVP